jgi:hypothetical protein
MPEGCAPVAAAHAGFEIRHITVDVLASFHWVDINPPGENDPRGQLELTWRFHTTHDRKEDGNRYGEVVQ